MYTNGFTGQKCLSLVIVKDCGGRTADVLTTYEFAGQSEHITLETDYNGFVVYEDGASGHLVSDFTGV